MSNPPAKDSPPVRLNYLTVSRLDRIASQLTDQDRQLVAFTAGVRLATGLQLIRHFWETSDRTSAAARSGRRTIKRLSDCRVLEPLPRRVGGRWAGSDATVYAVGLAGRKFLARAGFRGRLVDRPGDRYVAHVLALTEIVVAAGEADRNGRLELVRLQSEPQCWRSYLSSLGCRQTLKPDLYVCVGAGSGFLDHWFVELDMNTESRATLLTKARRYQAYRRSGREQAELGAFPRVIWAVPDDKRAEEITNTFQRAGIAAELAVVCQQDQLIATIAAKAAR